MVLNVTVTEPDRVEFRHRVADRRHPTRSRRTSTSSPARPSPTSSSSKSAPAARSASTTSPAPPTSSPTSSATSRPRPAGATLLPVGAGAGARHPQRERRAVGSARCLTVRSTCRSRAGVAYPRAESAPSSSTSRSPNPTASSFVTVWPTGVTRPVASNLNFVRRPDHPQPRRRPSRHRRQDQPLQLRRLHRPHRRRRRLLRLTPAM